MSVVDAFALAETAAVVYNTDVADSVSVANYWCDQRGIPRANRIGFAMGTRSDYWAYDADRFTNFYEPLYDHVVSIGATGVYVAAGCPNTLHCQRQFGGTETTIPLDLAIACQFVKYVHTDGYALRAYDGSGSGTYLAARGSSTQGTTPGSIYTALTTRASGYVQTYNHARYQAAIAAAGQGHQDFTFTRPTAGFDRDYTRFNKLLGGRVGSWPTPSASFPGTLLADSQAVINRAVQGETPLATAKGKPIVVGISQTTTYSGSCPASVIALVYDELIQNGFTNVSYFYEATATGDDAADYLAPEAGMTFTEAELDAGTVDQEYFLALGTAFQNTVYDPSASPTWRGAGNLQFTPATGGMMIAGKSDDDDWCRASQEDGGVGGVAAWTHQGTNIPRYLLEQVQRLIAGWSVAEAVWWGGDTEGYYVATGDPLYRPIRV